MIIRSLALFALSIVLSGCFGSNDELWPVKSGERISSLAEGEYNCMGYDNGVPEPFVETITSVSEGANIYYIFKQEGLTDNYGSFHKILPDLYLLASANVNESTKILTYVRITEGHAVPIRPTREQRDEYATKHGVTFDEFGMLEGNVSILQRRNFIIDLGKNLEKANMIADCVPA